MPGSLDVSELQAAGSWPACGAENGGADSAAESQAVEGETVKDLREMVFEILPENVGGFAVRVGDAKELLDELKAARRRLAELVQATRTEGPK